MVVSYEWLKELANLSNIEDKNFIDQIIMNGMEVENVIYTGMDKQDIVVCEIKSIDKHPEADRLSITKIDAGSFGEKQVITNLTQIKVGDKLLVALEGVTLAENFKIKKTKMKGVESEGMFIGWEELGFDHKSEDPIFIESSAKNGTKYYDLLPFIDTIVDIELTANRGDCLGMVGMAREAAARFDTNIAVLEYDYPTLDTKVDDSFSVEISTENCARYCGGIIRDVKIGPAPLWMQLRLVKAGIRPISNVVDITNYVLLEQNQPLHAFDLDKIENNKIIVRNAKDGEKMTTLDGIERTLESQDIVISSEVQGHCLGGIMGGQISEVTDSTTNIFLEAAFFNPKNIRKASRRLNLRSDSSYRFEREIDRKNVDKALKRALYLFDKLSVGKIEKGIIDIYPDKYEEKQVTFTTEWINNKLGSKLTDEKVTSILKKLFFTVKRNGADLVATVPSWRNDVAIKEDIAEEVGRIYGYNNLENTNYPSTQAAARTPFQKKERDLLNLMYNLGCNEAFNFSFIGNNLFDKLELPKDHKYRKAVFLQTPLTDEWAGMRTSLIPGMVRTTAFNVTRQNKNFALFEVGNITTYNNDNKPFEEKMVSVVLAGNKRKSDFATKEEKYDFFDLKGIVEEIFNKYAVKVSYKLLDENFLQPGQQAKILTNGEEIGIMGKFHPSIADKFDIDIDMFIAEINVTKLFSKADTSIVYQQVPKFPSSERDMAVIIDESIKSEDIFKTINDLKIDILQNISIFDIYRGENIENGKYSIAVKLQFNKITSTLKDKEIDKEFNKILKALETNLEAHLR